MAKTNKSKNTNTKLVNEPIFNEKKEEILSEYTKNIREDNLLESTEHQLKSLREILKRDLNIQNLNDYVLGDSTRLLIFGYFYSSLLEKSDEALVSNEAYLNAISTLKNYIGDELVTISLEPLKQVTFIDEKEVEIVGKKRDKLIREKMKSMLGLVATGYAYHQTELELLRILENKSRDKNYTAPTPDGTKTQRAYLLKAVLEKGFLEGLNQTEKKRVYADIILTSLPTIKGVFDQSSNDSDYEDFINEYTDWLVKNNAEFKRDFSYFSKNGK